MTDPPAWVKVFFFVVALFVMPDAIGFVLGLIPPSAIYGGVPSDAAQLWIRRGAILVVYALLMLLLALLSRVGGEGNVPIVFLCDRALKALETWLLSGSWATFGAWSAALAVVSLLAWRLGMRLQRQSQRGVSEASVG